MSAESVTYLIVPPRLRIIDLDAFDPTAFR